MVNVRNLNDDRLVLVPIVIPAADIDSAGVTGIVTLTIGELRTVEGFSLLEDETAYKLGDVTLGTTNPNQITVVLYDYDYAIGADGVATLWASQSDVQLVNAIAWGYR